MPVSATLPGGYLGTVDSVSVDGRTVTLKAAGFAEAFDYYNVHVDLSRAKPMTLTAAPQSVHPASGADDRRQARAAAARGLLNCNTSTGTEVVPRSPKFHIDPREQYTHAQFTMTSLPPRATLDLAVTVDATAAFDITTTEGVKCGLPFLKKLVFPFPTGPVPLALVIDPNADISVSGETSAKNVGFAVTGGFWLKAKVEATIPNLFVGKVLPIDVTATGDVWHFGTLTNTNYTSNVTATMRLGGGLTFGPGGGLPDVGAVAGIGGKFYPLKASFRLQSPASGSPPSTCVKAALGFESELNLNGKVWAPVVGSHTQSLTVPELQFNKDYASWYLPAGCEQPQHAPVKPPTNDDHDGDWWPRVRMINHNPDNQVVLYVWDQAGNSARNILFNGIPDSNHVCVTLYCDVAWFDEDAQDGRTFTYGLCSWGDDASGSNVTMQLKDPNGARRTIDLRLGGAGSSVLVGTSPPNQAGYTPAPGWCAPP